MGFPRHEQRARLDLRHGAAGEAKDYDAKGRVWPAETVPLHHELDARIGVRPRHDVAFQLPGLRDGLGRLRCTRVDGLREVRRRQVVDPRHETVRHAQGELHLGRVGLRVSAVLDVDQGHVLVDSLHRQLSDVLLLRHLSVALLPVRRLLQQHHEGLRGNGRGHARPRRHPERGGGFEKEDRSLERRGQSRRRVRGLGLSRTRGGDPEGFV
mmetsp:Transcript_16203/g.44815  ORF Transcript_16203/g.44815 Transcript_16203/m.44815 type:complete len:211 (-) Transcript_16203:1856-2488(-)